jgi:hypothetical protein
MTARKITAAATPVASVQPAVASIEITNVFDHAAIIKELADAESAQARMLILSKRTLGEVAAVGGRVANMGESVNETLNIKLCEKHGADWVKVYKSLAADLTPAEKTRKKAIHDSLESVRSTIQANSGGDKAKARNIIHRVKEWGEGKRTSKASNPKANTKRGMREYLLSWDVMPSIYRRISKDEGSDDNEMALSDAIAVYFKANGILPRAVLDCTGEAAWKVS